MFPSLEKFLATLAISAIAVTAALWVFPPDLRFPDPSPESGVSSASPADASIEAAPALAPVPSTPPDELTALEMQNEPPVPIVASDTAETGQSLTAILSPDLREKLPEASLSDEDIKALVETMQVLRESMQSLREVERIPENAERIRELMARIEENRRRFEKATGISIAEFVQRMTASGIDNDKRDENKVVLETLDGPGR